ncbi:M56 family metallopeptidase [Rufibacter sp. LB8]|uniref:M56 family metallopeptidase n=1 Tax=Rufibacter sp. LB8 TaxID=2777781 RepID=UPI00178C3028|nr:M56 family metallopeptidase [Rufibacter sp. LB8]
MTVLAVLMNTSGVVQALCWTLLHSVWQGLVLAVAAGLVVQLTKRAAPAVRYNLLAGLFVLFLAASAVTFWQQMQQTHLQGATSHEVFGQQLSSYSVYQATSLAPEVVVTDWVAAFKSFCTRHALYIVLGWFVVFAVKCLQLVGGLHYLVRLRKENVSVPAVAWQQKLEQLAALLRLNVPVTLLESGLVQVPLVIGFLKPLVLVPVGMLAQVPMDQVEAILLHELAHIRRRDYLVNLLQTFAEVLFFFNPAVLWLSARIRQERENCCDDLAIQTLQSKSNFLQALVTFQEYNFHRFGLAPSFAETSSSLTDRVKRIIYQHNAPLQRSEKFFVVVCFAVVSVGVLAFTKPAAFSEKAKQVVQTLNIYLPAKPQTIPSAKVTASKTAVTKNPQRKEKKLALAPLLNKPLYNQETLPEGGATKSCDGILTRYMFKKGGVLYEVEKDSVAVLALKINGQHASPEKVQLYKVLLQELMHQYDQGEISIVVNGQVPHVTSEPENPLFIKFLQNGTITTDHDGNVFEIKVKDHKVMQFSVNNKTIRSADIQRNKALILELVKEAETDRVYAELTAQAVDKFRLESPLLEHSTPTLPVFEDFQYTYLGRNHLHGTGALPLPDKPLTDASVM